MAAIWDERLAEVWATPGKAGAGVVVGDAAVLTARHVVAGAASGGKILSRVIKPGSETAAWVPMTVLAEDPDWDVAVLGIAGCSEERAGDSGREWLTPSSSPPVFVRLGTSAERGCEAVGFPQSEVQRTPDGDPAGTVRQSEHVVGILLPAGQAKKPVNPERPLPRRWMPLDVEESTPGTQAGWGGMSGAGVVLDDGRLAGLVVAAESGHQRRRLYIVPIHDVLAESGRIATALTAVLGDPAVIEAREAPLFRDHLQDACLAPEGVPVLVRDADLKAFGVKVAGVPGEPSFLEYVPRDADQKLRDGLGTAQAERRMLLVVGGSAGGKSRSAAEAARLQLPGHRLVCPRSTSLAHVRELPPAGSGPALAWLDDVERFDERAFRDSVEWLLRSGVVVVATIRRTELEQRMPKGDLRNPLGEALTDSDLVVTVPWPTMWNDQERARVREHVRYPALLAWVAAGRSPSAWVVAGPALQNRLRDAEGDDERPARFAVVRTVLDWYRTGIIRPMPLAVIPGLLHAYLPYEAVPAEIEEALQWAFESVTGAGHLTSQSLLAKMTTTDAITVHDYIQDADAEAYDRVVPDPVWMAALEEATSGSARSLVGFVAALQGNTRVASEAWLPLALGGDTTAMFNLGALLKDSDPGQARRWLEKAAKAGNVDAMNNLGVLLKDINRGKARRWLERAAEAGNVDAMNNLGVLLKDINRGQARRWLERAADTGNASAMSNLGLLLKDSDPGQARDWHEKAAETGNADAMFNLGMLLKDSDPEQARRWWEKAAEAGHAGAMNNLGGLLKDSDPEQARRWLKKAAEAGTVEAMFNLGMLLTDSDPEQARRWLKKAAEAGHAGAMNNLGALLKDSDPGQARRWWEKAAKAGQHRAMFGLGVLLTDSDPGQARRWYEKAAKAGHPAAMLGLGVLLKDRDPGQARRWYEKAAEAGHPDSVFNVGGMLKDSDSGQARRMWEGIIEAIQYQAMFSLGALLTDSDPSEARRWYEKAAEAGHPGAMLNLGALVTDSDPGEARRWYEKAAEAEHPGAMTNLGALLTDSDLGQEARRMWDGTIEAIEAAQHQAMYYLGMLLTDSDPGEARRWYEKAAEAGHPGAMLNLGALLKDSDPGQARCWHERAAKAGVELPEEFAADLSLTSGRTDRDDTFDT